MSGRGGDKYVLAIDHGTSGMKTALLSMRGELICQAYEFTPTYYFPGGGAEQDPDDWWNALISTSREVVSKGLVPVKDIEAICCSSTFSSTVAVDSGGRHLMNSLTWMDSRGAPHIRRLISGFPSVNGYRLSRMLPWIYKTGGGPQLSGKDDIAHVLYVKYDLPEIYRKTHMFLSSKDFLNLKLTGHYAAGFDSMTLFWVTNTRDPNNIHYDDWLLKKAGIAREKLPPLKSAVDFLGPVLPEVAESIGVGKDVSVFLGTPDHQAAGIGSGAVRDFEGHIYIGTSSWIQCVVPFKKTDVFHSIASLPTAIPGKYYCANEQDTAGGCLSFLLDKMLFAKNELNRDAPPDGAYGILDRIAEKVPPGSRGVVFTPWLNGERTPVDDTATRAGFYNLSLGTTQEDLIRAVMEGVALNNRWALKYVEKFVDRRLEPLTIVGGGARSDLWCGIFADVLKRRIRQAAVPLEANARGAAFIAAAALGHITFDEIPGLVKISREFEPDESRGKLYDELFGVFLEIYKKNKSIYRRLNRR